MTSLMDEIVNEIAVRTPEATPEQIGSYLIQLLQEEILPEAFSNASFPVEPSPFQILRTRFWLRRARKKRKLVGERQLEIWQLLEQFESVKHDLRGPSVDINSSKNRAFGYADATIVIRREPPLQGTVLRRRPLRGDGFPSIETEAVKRKVEKLEEVLPYNLQRETEERRLFGFDLIVQKKIATDSLFSRGVAVIERATNVFFFSRSIQPECRLMFRKDQEIPEWEKYVLSIDARGLDFDSKMKLWDEFDFFLRTNIKKKILQASEQEAKELKKLNDSLFTRIDLEDGLSNDSL